MTDTAQDRIAAMTCPVVHTILDPAVQIDPWAFYRELHESCPVFPIPQIGGVMVTRYEDIRFVLLHPELFASGGRHTGRNKKGLQVDKSQRVGATSKPCNAPIHRSTPTIDAWSTRRSYRDASARWPTTSTRSPTN